MTTTYEWQYNGAAPMPEIVGWCIDNLKSFWGYNGFETLMFSDRNEYIFFLLRWS